LFVLIMLVARLAAAAYGVVLATGIYYGLRRFAILSCRATARGVASQALGATMKTKTTAVVAAGVLVLAAGAGYAGGAAGAESAAAHSPAQNERSMDSMMKRDDGHTMGRDRASMMAAMMDRQHAKMMRDPAMRKMHRGMVREHSKMMQDPAMRKAHGNAMREFPEMPRTMRDHTKD
jgi:hypothetical protein